MTCTQWSADRQASRTPLSLCWPNSNSKRTKFTCSWGSRTWATTISRGSKTSMNLFLRYSTMSVTANKLDNLELRQLMKIYRTFTFCFANVFFRAIVIICPPEIDISGRLLLGALNCSLPTDLLLMFYYWDFIIGIFCWYFIIGILSLVFYH